MALTWGRRSAKASVTLYRYRMLHATRPSTRRSSIRDGSASSATQRLLLDRCSWRPQARSRRSGLVRSIQIDQFSRPEAERLRQLLDGARPGPVLVVLQPKELGTLTPDAAARSRSASLVATAEGTLGVEIKVYVRGRRHAPYGIATPGGRDRSSVNRPSHLADLRGRARRPTVGVLLLGRPSAAGTSVAGRSSSGIAPPAAVSIERTAPAALAI